MADDWAGSNNNEVFNGPVAASREEAIQLAREQYGGTVFVGRVVECYAPEITDEEVAEYIFERWMDEAEQHMIEEVGSDVTDGYPATSLQLGVREEAIKEIAAILNRVTPVPSFFKVADVETVAPAPEVLDAID